LEKIRESVLCKVPLTLRVWGFGRF
jgi:hypothetical protein